MASYEVNMRDEGGSRESVTIEADTLEDACAQADAETRAWIKGGEWGDEGAAVSAWWELTDEDGDGDGDAVEEGRVTVDIEPNHGALIAAACGNQWDARQERSCGTDPDDHDWTSAGEGGCDSNPGVWSTGGTAILCAAHCRACGLQRRTLHTGSQRDPGDHDTVRYTMPEQWCDECQREECACAED